MIIYLYLKIHNKTGYQYLGKTTRKNPHLYPGSGKLWKRHLNKHGRDYKTIILRECHSEEELLEWGLYYSKLWNVIENENFANLMEETGDGGATMTGRKHSIDTIKKLSKPKSNTENMKTAQQRMAEYHSKKQKEWHANPENMTKKLESMKKGCQSKEVRQKQAITMKKLKWCNDGIRNYRLEVVPSNFSLGRM